MQEVLDVNKRQAGACHVNVRAREPEFRETYGRVDEPCAAETHGSWYASYVCAALPPDCGCHAVWRPLWSHAANGDVMLAQMLLDLLHKICLGHGTDYRVDVFPALEE